MTPENKTIFNKRHAEQQRKYHQKNREMEKETASFIVQDKELVIEQLEKQPDILQNVKPTHALTRVIEEVTHTTTW